MREAFFCSLLLLAAACRPSNEPRGERSAPGLEQAARAQASEEQAGGAIGARGAKPSGQADIERGELLSLACRACHTLGAGEPTILGPNLHGVFGRRAGSQPGFEYSEALRSSEIVWTPELLASWLAAPAQFMPGNNMVFAGLKSASDRRDLIAYLLRETGKPAE